MANIHKLLEIGFWNLHVTVIVLSFRLERLKKFVKSITKLTRSDLARVIVPDVFRLEDLNQVFDR